MVMVRPKADKSANLTKAFMKHLDRSKEPKVLGSQPAIQKETVKLPMESKPSRRRKVFP